MNNKQKRSSIRAYFYGGKGPIIVATLGTVVAGLLGLMMGGLPVLVGINLLGAFIWWLVERLSVSASKEKQYDECIQEDLEQFSKRALDKLGIVSEEISLIEPIKVTGPYYDYKEEEIKQNSYFIIILKISIKIMCLPVYLIYKGVRTIIAKDNYRPRLIFKYGSDDATRYSMVDAHIFLFSETQIYVYRISYDICSGEIFEESTSEYFYQDVDCVITGEKTEKVMAKKEVKMTKFEYFKVIVGSGTSTHAIVDCNTSILETQVMGMRSLIRSKKEEGMSS